jgi:alpha-N-arabinofuranosidase
MARITIDPDRKLGRIDRKVYGNFIEHLGRCIYGGVFEPGSPLSDERGFRRDVLDAARALKVPILRWPGGNFVSGYHWTDGIGPREKRPRRIELAWRSEEPNQFGTDEFMEYCRELGTEPYLCINMGTGTMDEAQAWVEYCNGTGDTYWANLRRANGHSEPYNVRYWGLGNEMYGAWQIGATTAEDYVKKARQFAAIMKWTDPTIELVSCGELGWTDWDRTVIDGLAAYVRYHSCHMYTGSSEYYNNVFAPHQADRALRICETLIERARYQQHIDHPIGIAFDEWNVWYRARGAETRLEEHYDLSDALAVATYLNIIIRHCRSVEIANYAQMVNVIAPIFTNAQGLFLQTVYHPLRLYAEHAQEVALDPLVESPTHTLTALGDETGHRPLRTVEDLGPFGLLDVTATCDQAGRQLCIAVVNRSADAALPAAIELQGRSLSGELTAYEVNGADPHTANSFEQRQAVTVRCQQVAPVAGSGLDYTFPPHSLTLLRGQMA